MKTCRCRKGVVAIGCERHSLPSYYIVPPAPLSFWQRFVAWLRGSR